MPDDDAPLNPDEEQVAEMNAADDLVAAYLEHFPDPTATFTPGGSFTRALYSADAASRETLITAIGSLAGIAVAVMTPSQRALIIAQLRAGYCHVSVDQVNDARKEMTDGPLD